MGFLSNLLNTNKNSTSSERSLAKTSPADELRIKETLGIRSLESMPVQAARAFQLACDPKSTLHDFIAVVESDENLSARIIKIANSVYFRRGEQALDISTAVTNIGLNELRCILSAAMLKSLLNSKSKIRSAIWANAVATGIAARILSATTAIPEGEAFLAGLLHDVGKLILLQRMPKEYEDLINKSYNSTKSCQDMELERFDLSHVEVGKWLAEKWNFPEAIRLAISKHHENWPSEEKKRGKGTNISMLIKASDALSHSLRLGHPTNLTSLGSINQQEISHIAKQLDQSLESINSFSNQIKVQFENEFSLYNSD